MCQDGDGNLVIDGRYLILVMLQWVVPLDEVKEGERLGEGVL